MIDLKKHRQRWENFYDAFICESRKNELRKSLKSVRHRSN